MLLSDTRAKTKKELIPLKKGGVRLFVCGPTVYDYSHIGHARTYIFFDAFIKYLRFKKYSVNYVQNITDIEDKIIRRAKESGRDPMELAAEFEKAYYEDMKAIGVDSVSRYARATDFIQEIISQIERLLEKGFAYKTSRGVYFEVAKFPRYGELSGQDTAKVSSQEEEPDTEKKQEIDFALWKVAKEGEPYWESPWGKGRPGWHIEDTAITEKLLGEQYDIHGGAQDLIFPHHEAEIAQMESVSGKHPLVNFWLHVGFLTVAGEKMSKSLGNFITIRKLLENWPKETFRLFVLTKHFRSPIAYKEGILEEFTAERRRAEDFSRRLAVRQPEDKNGETEEIDTQKLAKFEELFWRELDDDFNTPRAFAALFEMINFANALMDKQALGKKEAKNILKFLKNLNGIFGILTDKEDIPTEITRLAEEREKMRQKKQFAEADKIRKQIEKMGYIVEDTPSGIRITRRD